jgi:predicted nucleic acid-binding protein
MYLTRTAYLSRHKTKFYFFAFMLTILYIYNMTVTQTMKIIKLYFDTCCYSRWQDDQTSAQIVAETRAIEGIINICHIVGHIIVGSPVVVSELLKNTDIQERDADIALFWETIDSYIRPSTTDFARAQAFRAAGLKRKDSRHLAVAEAAGVDVLLTVDNGFLRMGGNRKLCKVRVVNPIIFLQEVINGYCC